MEKEILAILNKLLAGQERLEEDVKFLKEGQNFGICETGDFEFKPLKAGIYYLHFIYANGFFTWTQK